MKRKKAAPAHGPQNLEQAAAMSRAQSQLGIKLLSERDALRKAHAEMTDAMMQLLELLDGPMTSSDKAAALRIAETAMNRRG